MDVSIIIVNYNTLKLTEQCIRSVIEKTKNVSFEIILVDNASSDGSKDFFSHYDDIKYIYSNINLGFGKANNLGLTHAIGRNILFLNSDTYLVNDAISILSNHLDNNPRVAVCGGNLFTENMTPNISFCTIFPSKWTELDVLLKRYPSRILKKRNVTFNLSDEPLEVAYISGADLMVKKSVLDQYGAFDPQFFMYYEETELCYRIKKYGYFIKNIPHAKIVHLNGGSQTKSNKPSKLYLNSRFIYMRLTKTSYIDWFFHYLFYRINYFLHKMLNKW